MSRAWTISDSVPAVALNRRSDTSVLVSPERWVLSNCLLYDVVCEPAQTLANDKHMIAESAWLRRGEKWCVCGGGLFTKLLLTIFRLEDF